MYSRGAGFRGIHVAFTSMPICATVCTHFRPDTMVVLLSAAFRLFGRFAGFRAPRVDRTAGPAVLTSWTTSFVGFRAGVMCGWGVHFQNYRGTLFSVQYSCIYGLIQIFRLQQYSFPTGGKSTRLMTNIICTRGTFISANALFELYHRNIFPPELSFTSELDVCPRKASAK